MASRTKRCCLSPTRSSWQEWCPLGLHDRRGSPLAGRMWVCRSTQGCGHHPCGQRPASPMGAEVFDSHPAAQISTATTLLRPVVLAGCPFQIPVAWRAPRGQNSSRYGGNQVREDVIMIYASGADACWRNCRPRVRSVTRNAPCMA
jgi:hypothetical protein